MNISPIRFKKSVNDHLIISSRGLSHYKADLYMIGAPCSSSNVFFSKQQAQPFLEKDLRVVEGLLDVTASRHASTMASQDTYTSPFIQHDWKDTVKSDLLTKWEKTYTDVQLSAEQQIVEFCTGYILNISSLGTETFAPPVAHVCSSVHSRMRTNATHNILWTVEAGRRFKLCPNRGLIPVREFYLSSEILHIAWEPELKPGAGSKGAVQQYVLNFLS